MEDENGKLKIFIVYAEKCLLVTLGSYFTLGVLATAFDFNVNTAALFLLLFISSIAVVFLYALFREFGVLIMTAVSLLPLLFLFNRISEDFKWVAFNITTIFNKWTPIPVLFPPTTSYPRLSEPVFFFGALGVGLVLLLTFAVFLRRSSFLAVFVTLPCVLLTFVITTTQADVSMLLGLLAVHLTLILSGGLTHIGGILIDDEDNIEVESGGKSASAIALSFALAVAFTGVLYLASPPDGYERSERISNIQSYMTGVVEQVIRSFTGGSDTDEADKTDKGWLIASDGETWLFNTENINVADAGRRTISNRQLLEIEVSQPGIFYLRGFSMGNFDGRAWASVRYNRERTDYERLSLERPGEVIQQFNDLFRHNNITAELLSPEAPGMSIRRINDVTNVDYLPYYTSAGTKLMTTYFVGDRSYDIMFHYVPENLRAYATEEVMSLLQDNKTWSPDANNIYLAEQGGFDPTSSTVREVDVDIVTAMNLDYTFVDINTAQGLRQLALDVGIDPSAEREVITDAVAEYVRSNGIYTLNPPNIPEGEDFALYFLQNSRAGYCIHFATAATLMLRSLDIPARFTSGYVATVSSVAAAQEGITITDRNAHAWVEVFYDDVGWLPLEVTPATTQSQVPVARPHTPAVQTSEATPSPASGAGGQATPTPAIGRGVGSDTSARREVPAFVTQSLIFVIVLALIVLLIITRRLALLAVRRRHFWQKNTNAAVIYMWHYAETMSRGQSLLPAEMEDLALKARFSTHRITEQERNQMISSVQTLAKSLYDNLEYSRVWFKYIRGFI